MRHSDWAWLCVESATSEPDSVGDDGTATS